VDRWCVLIVACAITAGAYAQVVQPPALLGASGQESAPASTGPKSKGRAQAEADESGAQPPQTRGSGRTSNRKPMDIRLRDGGVKLPKCANESREGLDCEK
jgi:hypothetical protein